MYEEENFLNVTMVSTYLHVAKSTIYKWVSQGSIPFVKLGNKTLFIKEHIDRWVYEKVPVRINMDLPEVPTYRKTG